MESQANGERPVFVLLQHGSHGRVTDFAFLIQQLMTNHGFVYCRGIATPNDLLRQFSSPTMVVGVLRLHVAMISHRAGSDIERSCDLPDGSTQHYGCIQGASAFESEPLVAQRGVFRFSTASLLAWRIDCVVATAGQRWHISTTT
jgi:hypothetical protein